MKTMQRLNADNFYYFSAEYFNKIFSIENAYNYFIGEVTTAFGEVIASALFFIDACSIHYHLGGSNLRYKELYPNVFLMFSVAQYACEQGLTGLHLGGCLSNSKNDSLFAFKKGFSSKLLDFYISKKIHNHKKYTQISKKWQTITSRRPKKLLHYHYGVEDENF